MNQEQGERWRGTNTHKGMVKLTLHGANVMEGTLTWKRKMTQRWQLLCPHGALWKECNYNYLKKMFVTPKMQEWHFISVQYIKVLQNDSYNDKKQKQATKKHSTTQNKGSHTRKMILIPMTSKISTMEQKCQKNDRKSMGQNLKEMTTFFTIRQN